MKTLFINARDVCTSNRFLHFSLQHTDALFAFSPFHKVFTAQLIVFFKKVQSGTHGPPKVDVDTLALGAVQLLWRTSCVHH